MEHTKQDIVPVEWKEEYVKVLDQTLLPAEEKDLKIRSAEQMWDAVKRLCVRGAPAIGIAAAYGVCIEMKRHMEASEEEYHRILNETVDYLATSRPTAVNLFWALERMRKTGQACMGKQMRKHRRNWKRKPGRSRNGKRQPVLRSGRIC